MAFGVFGVIASVAGAAAGAIGAGKMQKEAERREREAREEMEAIKATYSKLDTSNPYANLENTMEDLTVNQLQYELESQQFSESQAGILSGLSEAAGGSGIAALAQSLSAQGQRASQQQAAKIGMQERQNMMAEREMAASNQNKEAEGDIWARNAERDKQATLMGMAHGEAMSERQNAIAAEQAKWGAIGEGVSALGGFASGGFGGGGGGAGGGGQKIDGVNGRWEKEQVGDVRADGSVVESSYGRNVWVTKAEADEKYGEGNW